MALLNSSAYNKLGDVSANQQRRAPGKFHAVFITGAARAGQDIGKLQCMRNMDDGEYFIQNSEKIMFIPYFIKRVWSKYAKAQNQTGSEYDKLVAFGWSDDIPKIDDQCKYSYIIAGVLLDDNGSAMKHVKANEEAEIKEGDPVLCYFSCGGTKFNGAMKFLELINEKAKDLPPLSDSPEFEKTVVYPRRFICSVARTLAPSSHGDKMVFGFDVVRQLPDSAVQQVIDSAMTFLTDFEKQFDKTAYVKSGSASDAASSLPPDAPVFSEPAPGPVPESTASGDDFNLGI